MFYIPRIQKTHFIRPRPRDSISKEEAFRSPTPFHLGISSSPPKTLPFSQHLSNNQVWLVYPDFRLARVGTSTIPLFSMAASLPRNKGTLTCGPWGCSRQTGFGQFDTFSPLMKHHRVTVLKTRAPGFSY